MMQVHHGHWVGTSFFFIGVRKPTNLGFLFIGGIERTYVDFLLEPGAVILYVWCSHIYHSKFFSLKNPFTHGKSMWGGSSSVIRMDIQNGIITNL